VGSTHPAAMSRLLVVVHWRLNRDARSVAGAPDGVAIVVAGAPDGVATVVAGAPDGAAGAPDGAAEAAGVMIAGMAEGDLIAAQAAVVRMAEGGLIAAEATTVGMAEGDLIAAEAAIAGMAEGDLIAAEAAVVGLGMIAAEIRLDSGGAAPPVNAVAAVMDATVVGRLRAVIAIMTAKQVESDDAVLVVTAAAVQMGHLRVAEVEDDGKGYIWVAAEMGPRGLVLETFKSTPCGKRARFCAKQDNVAEMFDTISWDITDKRVDTTLGGPHVKQR